MLSENSLFEYVSTRDPQKRVHSYYEVLLAGIAKDGGLYVPRALPRINPKEFFPKEILSYQQIALKILRLFLPPTLSDTELEMMVNDAYATFDHEEISPLIQLDESKYVMELFHGPTLAFKDFAMQFLAQLMQHAISEYNKDTVILGATSGDTGAAAIEAFKDKERIKVVILFPQGRVSKIQQYQMTATGGKNIYPIAIKGTFDDCQDIVKSLLREGPFTDSMHLCGVNSINWFRIITQIVYYFYAYNKLRRPLNFSVPTGNFGNILAGYYAMKVGLPIEKLIIATNENDILVRTRQCGEYKVKQVKATQSPSMDIQVSSNFERLLYELSQGRAEDVDTYMQDLRQKGAYTLNESNLQKYKDSFEAIKITEQKSSETIRNVWSKYGYMLDPHTAIAYSAAQHATETGELILSLATAHPCKFPHCIKKVTGHTPSSPSRIKKLSEQSEEYEVMLPEKEGIKKYIRERIS